LKFQKNGVISNFPLWLDEVTDNQTFREADRLLRLASPECGQ
jgi:hypothetical protein